MRLFFIGIGTVIGLMFLFAVIFGARHAETEPSGQATQTQKLDVDAFIQRWDADHDGVLSRDELKKAINSRFRDKLIDKLFQVGDKNQDGRLDKSELNTLAHESFLSVLVGARYKPTS
jgi:hypothetical protein